MASEGICSHTFKNNKNEPERKTETKRKGEKRGGVGGGKGEGEGHKDLNRYFCKSERNCMEMGAQPLDLLHLLGHANRNHSEIAPSMSGQ